MADDILIEGSPLADYLERVLPADAFPETYEIAFTEEVPVSQKNSVSLFAKIPYRPILLVVGLGVVVYRKWWRPSGIVGILYLSFLGVRSSWTYFRRSYEQKVISCAKVYKSLLRKSILRAQEIALLRKGFGLSRPLPPVSRLHFEPDELITIIPTQRRLMASMKYVHCYVTIASLRLATSFYYYFTGQNVISPESMPSIEDGALADKSLNRSFHIDWVSDVEDGRLLSGLRINHLRFLNAMDEWLTCVSSRSMWELFVARSAIIAGCDFLIEDKIISSTDKDSVGSQSSKSDAEQVGLWDSVPHSVSDLFKDLKSIYESADMDGKNWDEDERLYQTHRFFSTLDQLRTVWNAEFNKGTNVLLDKSFQEVNTQKIISLEDVMDLKETIQEKMEMPVGVEEVLDSSELNIPRIRNRGHSYDARYNEYGDSEESSDDESSIVDEEEKSRVLEEMRARRRADEQSRQRKQMMEELENIVQKRAEKRKNTIDVTMS